MDHDYWRLGGRMGVGCGELILFCDMNEFGSRKIRDDETHLFFWVCLEHMHMHDISHPFISILTYPQFATFLNFCKYQDNLYGNQESIKNHL
jgi:hypothetical protein